ncbi:heavy metal translocating P-type ATPase [Streptomyces caniscabiei]|uniref:Heavy metal translocating P-type ATPase n=1 Tax=Streptomyces caniscabiei TaxID=2746961 RepID=A0ABU4MM71_9ACTN|nr:heavy metal translocating P-type ATPase [Streptomyces caniscabiei]MBE4738477.1 heavy metal translocating P-type ATPase [Streptomyces caniscabiei]MBE4756726.1 heavy metal translocating P-type ATPase [Streptomyces caniscabiei]MBE4768769.1 heavy metal translocating P-type ATPase [Streptomyces caniscabiei]MBE4783097.1 heavy metal translocating P-type ATPase [Streptomyces caniscabiei]MBE4792401.1 heavy metal translocating P-type ATPase [Streptomyces caniscabiei]
MVCRVSATLTPTPVRRPSATTAPRRRTRVLALPEARWALTSTLAFLLAFPLDLAGASAWLYGPLYVIAYAAGGWEPALEGLRALREKSLDVDLLMIVAALGAAAIGQVLDGALLIVIFATSGALEALATARTADSVRGLLDLAPTTATRLSPDGTAEETVPTDRLAVGDLVLVRPGERIGADGRVVAGESEADQATITGEPLPVPKAPGDEVFAGTLNGTGALRVRVARDPADSVIARIVGLVEEASRTKAPTQLFIEKIEQRYAVGVVVATLAVFGVPLAFGEDLTAALLRAMTFMIVASPCAVVLATMPPLLSAIANAGRHGVLVKSAVAMERLGEIDAAALDKTGTLTEGTPEVVAVRPLPGSGLDEDGLLALAAAAEYPSEHPLARAVVAAAGARGLRVAAAEDFVALPGRGVRATVEGRVVAVGRAGEHAGIGDGTAADGTAADGAAVEGTALDGAVTDRAAADRAVAEGTTVVVERDGVAVGTLTLADRLRPDAPAAVSALTALTGGSPVLLTGDNARAAARVAADTGIDDVRAELLPEGKVEAVRELQNGGAKVLFVGDGVNDAPALAAAHAGVAMGRAGSDLALETADAVVVRDELRAIPAVVRLSRAARRLVVQNLVIAGVCIAVLVVWDLVGHLPLPLGVAGHEGSTVLVGLNGLRLLREGAWGRAAGA